MMEKTNALVAAAPLLAIPSAVPSRDYALGEPLSFALSFAAIFLVLLLDYIFEKLGG
jgi:hypothetical protein